MGSGLIYAAIVAIWGLLLVPMWMRKHETEQKISGVESFKAAMDSLSDSLIPEPRRTPTVHTKRAIRTGLLDPDKKRRMQLRRRAFSAVIASLPVSVLGVVGAGLPLFTLLTPFVSFAIYVGWVRSDIRRRAEMRKPRTAIVEVNVEKAAPTVAAKRAESHEQSNTKRSHLWSGLAAIRRSATERLLETEPELETAETESWQPAVSNSWAAEPAKSWTAPEPVMPAYVSAPAATAVPREIDRVHGEWNAEAMLKAAAEQQRQETLADLVAAVQAEEAAPVAIDSDPTAELPRIATA
jgi:hypothetical protein